MVVWEDCEHLKRWFVFYIGELSPGWIIKFHVVKSYSYMTHGLKLGLDSILLSTMVVGNKKVTPLPGLEPGIPRLEAGCLDH